MSLLRNRGITVTINKPPDPTKDNIDESLYVNLFSYFKYLVSLTLVLISLLGGFVAFLTYKDRSSMREEYSSTLKDLKSEIKELKTDAIESIKQIKTDAKETALATRDEAKQNLELTKDNANEAVQNIKEETSREVARIKFETNQVALDETKKQLAAIFQSNTIQDLIENQAVKQVRNQVTQIVANETKNYLKISDAGSEMRTGNWGGMIKLKSYFLYPENAGDSARAKTLYDEICRDYLVTAKLNDRFMVFDGAAIRIKGYRIPTDTLQRKQLADLLTLLNDPNDNLNQKASVILVLSRIANRDFKPFDLDEINVWYKSLTK